MVNVIDDVTHVGPVRYQTVPCPDSAPSLEKVMVALAPALTTLGALMVMPSAEVTTGAGAARSEAAAGASGTEIDGGAGVGATLGAGEVDGPAEGLGDAVGLGEGPSTLACAPLVAMVAATSSATIIEALRVDVCARAGSERMGDSVRGVLPS